MPPDDVTVRVARPPDAEAVRGLLETALLDPAPVEPAVADGRTLAAAGRRDGPLLGALLAVAAPPAADAPAGGDGVVPPDATHVDAVAVRPGRRGRGIGSALVAAAADRWGALTAAYAEDVRPFYGSCGFAVRATLADGRLFGVRR